MASDAGLEPLEREWVAHYVPTRGGNDELVGVAMVVHERL